MAETYPQFWFKKDNRLPEQKYSLVYIYTEKDRDGNKTNFKVEEEVVSYTYFDSVLMPGKTLPMYIDKKTNMIFSFLFQSFLWLLDKDYYVWPVIKAEVRYKDYELSQRKLTFNLKIDEYFVKDDKLEIKIKVDINSIENVLIDAI